MISLENSKTTIKSLEAGLSSHQCHGFVPLKPALFAYGKHVSINYH